MPIAYMDHGFRPVPAERTGQICYTAVEERVNAHITRHLLTYRNEGEACDLIPVFELVTQGTVAHYMIPCANYNGNQWGTGQEPKGMTRDGKPWIFPPDRVGVPGCSVVQTEDACIAVFSGNENTNASASVFQDERGIVQRVYFSYIEYPKSYLRKYVYGEEKIEYIHFETGQERTFVCYTYRKNREPDSLYGYSELFDYLNTDYAGSLPRRFGPEQVRELNYRFIESVTEHKDGGYISNIGFLPGGEHRIGDPDSTFLFRKGGNYEVGWCGQGISVAEMYLRRYLETKDPADLEVGTGILDTWVKRQYPSGMVSVRINGPMGGETRLDTCNLGWFVWKGIWCCELLKEAGKDPAVYEAAIKKLCDGVREKHPEGGFPQILDCNGGVTCLEGCAGTMLLTGYLYAYGYFGDERYLQRAVSAFDFYYDTYLRQSVAAGGALDTSCIAKESAGPLLRAALLLYRHTQDGGYLSKAEDIAHYLMTWCFYHDVPFPPDSDCGALGVRTTGGTSVSAAHHHLDCWGAYYVPDMAELYDLTGNRAYFVQARLLWDFTTQYISDGDLVLHGMRRMAGAQNEAVLQCNWHGLDEKKGQLNDWLIIWVKTFQLDAYYAMRKLGRLEVLEGPAFRFPSAT